MKVLITGGGTAGHINPAIAIAQYIKSEQPAAKILYAGTPDHMEAELVKRAGFDFTPIPVMGFSREKSLKSIGHNVSAVMTAMKARQIAKKVLNKFQPDIVIGTGGYVCGPLVLTACKMGIKTAVHEQNAFPGVAIKLLSQKVDLVFLAVEEAKKHLNPNCNFEVVGNPIRPAILKVTRDGARRQLGLDDEKFCIFSVGGSLGADSVNRIAADLMEWHYQNPNIVHIHGYGRLGKEKFPALLAERGIDLAKDPQLDVREYIDNMDVCLAAADLVVCRCGALTLSELEVMGKPSILIPSPNVTENHQYHNGMVLVNHNAAIMVEEKDYQKEDLIQQVESFYIDRSKLKRYAANAAKLGVYDTTAKIYASIQKLIGNQ